MEEDLFASDLMLSRARFSLSHFGGLRPRKGTVARKHFLFDRLIVSDNLIEMTEGML